MVNLLVKPKILELSTGMNNVEEWSFLPETGGFYLGRERFDDHFAFIRVSKSGPIHGYDDLLILNLISRKQFWMKTLTIANQMRTQVGDRNTVDTNSRLLRGPRFSTQIGKDGIEIKYQVRLFFADRIQFLGRIFRHQNFPMFKRHW